MERAKGGQRVKHQQSNGVRGGQTAMKLLEKKKSAFFPIYLCPLNYNPNSVSAASTDTGIPVLVVLWKTTKHLSVCKAFLKNGTSSAPRELGKSPQGYSEPASFSGATAHPDETGSAKTTFELWIAKQREFLTAAFTSLSAELFRFCPDVENSLQNPVDCSVCRSTDGMGLAGCEGSRGNGNKETQANKKIHFIDLKIVAALSGPKNWVK